MIIYTKKSAILTSLGKDSKDTKYLDRAIDRGDVGIVKDEKECTYYINIGEFLKDMIVDYEERRKRLLSESEGLDEMKANVEYYEKENSELRDKNIALEAVMEKLREGGAVIGYGNNF